MENWWKPTFWFRPLSVAAVCPGCKQSGQSVELVSLEDIKWANREHQRLALERCNATNMFAPVGEGDGLGMLRRGPDESALLPLSSDLCTLSSVRSLDPERALEAPYAAILLSRESERKISPSTRELMRADVGVALLQKQISIRRERQELPPKGKRGGRRWTGSPSP